MGPGKPMAWTTRIATTLLLTGGLLAAPVAGPRYVDITWFSIANIYYQFNATGVLTDGYITRVPASEFYGGGGGLARTRNAWTPDTSTVSRVLGALGGPPAVSLLLTGHSHFDHSFDTATWSRLTGTPVVDPGPRACRPRPRVLPGLAMPGRVWRRAHCDCRGRDNVGDPLESQRRPSGES